MTDQDDQDPSKREIIVGSHVTEKNICGKEHGFKKE
jgi:hypothetical protein